MMPPLYSMSPECQSGTDLVERYRACRRDVAYMPGARPTGEPVAAEQAKPEPFVKVNESLSRHLAI
jgi:hypothetical protein